MDDGRQARDDRIAVGAETPQDQTRTALTFFEDRCKEIERLGLLPAGGDGLLNCPPQKFLGELGDLQGAIGDRGHCLESRCDRVQHVIRAHAEIAHDAGVQLPLSLR
ncbi:MAG: hypothetical protein ACRD1H_18545, partial [Vicinamibacterales bacterium]